MNKRSESQERQISDFVVLVVEDEVKGSGGITFEEIVVGDEGVEDVSHDVALPEDSIAIGDVDGLEDSLDELFGVMEVGLVRVRLGLDLPVHLKGLELLGISKGLDVGSELSDLWGVDELLLNVSNSGVVLVKFGESSVIDLNSGSLGSTCTRHLSLGGLTDLHVSLLHPHHFLIVCLDQFLGLWIKIRRVHVLGFLDEIGKFVELWGLNELMHVTLNLGLELVRNVVSVGLLHKSTLLLLESMHILLMDGHLEKLVGFVHLLHWRGGDDGEDSGG